MEVVSTGAVWRAVRDVFEVAGLLEGGGLDGVAEG